MPQTGRSIKNKQGTLDQLDVPHLLWFHALAREHPPAGPPRPVGSAAAYTGLRRANEGLADEVSAVFD
jgi:hypothetical protein